MKTSFAPGASVPRTEDTRLLTGKGRFADDLQFPDQAHAAIVRSPYAHAAIRGIDKAAALEMPGVLAVLTAEDWEADGLGGLFAFANFLSEPLLMLDGREFTVPLRKPLAATRAIFAGEAVAVVLAETAAQALDAVALVEVEYKELPAAADTTTAADPDAPLVREDVPRNTIFIRDFGDFAATEAAFASAPHVVTTRLVNTRVAANPLEPRAINAIHDAATGHFTIWGGTQHAFLLRDILAEHVFRIPSDRIDIVAGDLGGSFGLKDSIPVEMALMPWAARRLGRPVKWTATRSEMIAADNHGRDLMSDAALAFDDEGKILAVRTENVNNHGAYVELFGMAPALVNIGGLVGPYTIPAAYAKVTGVLSHTSAVAPYRGAGRPEATYVIERLIDLAAARIGLDPVDMRRRNLIPASAMPYRTALTFTYDCGDFAAVMAKAVAAADYAGFPARCAEAEARGKLRGIGVAMCIETSGGAGREYVELKMAAHGRLQVLAGSNNHGQGHETVLIQQISTALGFAPEDIDVVESDTRVVRRGEGTGGSGSAAFNATAAREAIRGCIEQGLPLAARLLQADPGTVSFAEGSYGVGTGGPRVSFVEVARASLEAAGSAPLQAMGEAVIDGPAFPNGCQIAEVEVDPATGTLALVAHTVCDDVGFELNPMLVKGQLTGGIAQGAGQALMEHLVIDASGQVLTGSFMDYAMPRATDLPRMTVLSHPVPTATNPLGIKGVGESGTVGSLAAVMNAVNNALVRAGAGPIDMPATPSRIWAALNAAAL
jgi:carbon-monoxide dehydrogenase large subunit